MEKMNNICQCCAMMMQDDDHGTNADGSINEDYCKYCFSDGQFTGNVCQSCAMIMKNDDHGTNADGSVNEDYCKYCFSDGKFSVEMTLEESIEDNIRFWIDDNCKTPEEAREKIRKVFPMLKRWKNK